MCFKLFPSKNDYLFMKYYKIISIIIFFLSVISNNSFTQTAPSFGLAKSFGVLAASTITNTGNTAIKGDIGVSPGAAITGFGPGTYTGTAYTGAASLAGDAQVSANAVYANLVLQTTTTDLTGQILGVDVLTLSPGVYFFSSSAQLTGTLTLNDGGNPDAVFIFKISSTLTTASSSQVVMSGGGNGVNVFWACGTAATLGTNTNFVGNIIASTSVSMTTGATNTGRLIALTGAVTLDANNAVSSQQNAFSLCEGGTAPVLSSNLGTGIPYQWYSNTVNSNTGGTLVIGATLPTYTPDVSVAGIFYYYAIANSFSSDVTKVTVIANTAITSPPVGYSVCLGGTASSLSVSAIGAGLSYQWYSNTTNSNSGGTLIIGATSLTYTPDITTVGVKYYYVVVSGTCTNATSNAATVTVNALPIVAAITGILNVCEGLTTTLASTTSGGVWTSATLGVATINSSTGVVIGVSAGTSVITYTVTNASACVTAVTTTVTVNANTAITSQPLGFSICAGGTSKAMSVSSTGGGLGYQWYSNTSNSNTGGILITGATSSTYTPDVTVAGVKYYYVVINGLCSVTTSNTAIVTVNTNAAIINQPIGFSVCAGGTASAMTVSSTGTGLSYQWYSNTINSNTGGILITGATSSTYTPNVTVAGVYYYYVLVDGICSDPASNAAMVTVNANTAITSQPLGFSICAGGTSKVMSVSSTGGGLSYQWYSNTSNSNTGGTLISGATSSTYTPVVTVAGVKYYYVVINGLCSVATSNTAIVTVNANAAITSQPLGFSVCVGGTSTSMTVSSTGTGLSYQWYSNIINSNTGGALIIGATSSSYTPNVSVVGVYYYYVLVDGICSDPASNAAMVTVNANTAITSQPLGFSVCAGGTSKAMSVSSTGIGLSYQWYSNTSNSNTGGILITGATSSTYTPDVTASGLKYYYVVVSGSCSNAISNTALVSVNNTNLINLSSAIGLDNQILNVNQTIDNIIYNTIGSSEVKAIDLPNGVVGIWNNNVFTISGASTKVGLFHYTIIITGGCKSTNVIQRGTITALPLPPIPIGGTYTSGAIGNPVNINETVKIPPSGTKLLFCDISGNNCNIDPPALPFPIGVYIWCVKVIDTASGLISRPCKYDTVYIIPPPYSIDISKHVDTIKLLSDGKYLVRFKIKATNKMNVKLDSIQLRDDLSKIFPGGIRVLSVFATGNLIQNHLYDGISVIDLVTPESSLSANSSDSILLSIIINGTVPPGTYQNSVIMGGKTIYGKGQLVSNDYFANPNNPSIRMPAKFVIAKQDLIIPGGFSPNTDGIDDRYFITHPITTKIQLQVYNRWGNLVYKSDNYKNDWDGVGQGNFLGQNVPPGTYYYVVIAVDLNTGVRNFAGPLTIVRQKY